MSLESPIFYVLFAAAWLTAAAYNVWLVLVSQRRRAITGEPRRSFFKSMFADERARWMFSELKFLFGGEHHRFGDETLSRRVMITRVLFAAAGALMLCLFVVAFTMITGDAPDVR